MAKGNQEKDLKTLQSTQKKIPNMKKNELAAESEEHRANKAKHHSAISKVQELNESNLANLKNY